MRKLLEQEDPNSCFNKARHDELIFVILERDAAAPDTIRFWAQKRIDMKRNKPEDQQIVDALALADVMELEMARGTGES